VSEFVCVTLGGPVRTIVVSGRRYRFEMHPHFGPNLVSPRGDILANQPGERSPFWAAVGHWDKQGRKVDSSGVCVWGTPPPIRWIHIGGNHYLMEAGQNKET
jgi:hypothetical protein